MKYFLTLFISLSCSFTFLILFQRYVSHTQTDSVDNNGFMNATTSSLDFATCDASDYVCVNRLATSTSTKSTKVLILGNSQLGAINNRLPSDNNYGSLVAKYFAKSFLGSINIYSVWMPNASLEEFSVVYSSISKCISEPDLLFIPVFLDDTRESAVRSDLDSYSSRICSPLNSYQPIAKSPSNPEVKPPPTNSHQVAEILRSLIYFLDYEELQNANNFFRGNLYLLRNFVFGINSESKRPIISSAYRSNIDFLQGIINKRSSSKLNTILYIPPIYNSSSSSIPYHMDQYISFKNATSSLCKTPYCTFYDFDSLISPNEWISTAKGIVIDTQAVDFMHFGALGHQILSEKLIEIVKQFHPLTD